MIVAYFFGATLYLIGLKDHRFCYLADKCVLMHSVHRQKSIRLTINIMHSHHRV